jgi:demethylmenaquinone methyltransferase/2-methoxy-6-polyprenyl-1,4-benzoquinol methylase
MPEDKSLFYYGSMFHRMFDPPLADARLAAASLIPDGISVLDIACGTGLFCAQLRQEKNCRVVGIDLSLKMIEFAKRSNPNLDVSFLHKDATDLSDFADHSFDYASILNLIHELPREKQLKVLREALRVARKVVLVDYKSPLPRNLGGALYGFTEATIGRDHYRNFRAFIAGGGFDGLFQVLPGPLCIEQRSLFSHNNHELLLITRPAQA